MSDIRFKADAVELNPLVGFIGFADTGSGRYFWMQPGETASGMSSRKDEIWLERDDQLWGGSGGDWRIRLTRNTFIVESQTLPWMACDSINIEFEADDAQYERLKTLLKTVMAGCQADLRIAPSAN